MQEADIIVLPEDMDLDEPSLAYLQSDSVDRKDARNVEILREYTEREPEGKSKQIIMRFLVSPVEIIGDGKVEAIKIVKNELYVTERGDIRPRATEEFEIIPVGLVFRSVGYKGVALPDVPFFDKWGIIPNNDGRVLTEHETGEQVIGDYVVGWIKRGPSGIIGTNKPDSVATVKALLEDMESEKLWSPSEPDDTAIENLVKSRKPNYVTYADWQIIDQLEVERGESQGRPRQKFTEIQVMLNALAEYKLEKSAVD
jgi:ferredoxin--NADP+ reductase